ncbi:decapping and exoribonuclease protein [Spea bombifrons]|uniref:decapping and exoribonuclease protein n=1 Tax=Spea bombifrons TaxID=233779 RepID=UPI002349B192|nr:decapping and exoribonuclease protein [Spea bombifrons]
MECDAATKKENGARPPKRCRDSSSSPPRRSVHLSSSSSSPPSSSLCTNHSLYQGPFPFFRLPSEVGRFSLDEERRYHGDARKLRYYKPLAGVNGKDASPGWDLMDGFDDRYVRRNEDEKEGLLHILTWVKENRGLLGGGSSSRRPVDRDFVTWRGHLTKILCTPYESQEDWLLAVTLFKGTLYISERETESARKKRQERTSQQDRLTYSGYKFESYMCADSPDGRPSSSGVINTNEAFCSVLLARLSSHSILVSGEVDCCDLSASGPKPPSCYVELKSSAQIRNPHQQRSFNRYKLLKWWCQSFLLGIPLIVAGFRSPEGRVVSLQNYRTSEIPHLIRADKHSWDPAVCMNFCEAFLSFVKKIVTADDPRVVYLFSCEPGSDITYSVHTDPAYAVLPPWYVEALSR